jgi:hypothetical protein
VDGSGVSAEPQFGRVRSWLERVAELAFVAVTVTAGAVGVLAPVLLPGLVLGGSACGGAGRAMRCRGITRELSLVDVSPYASAYVGAGVLCVLLGTAALFLARARVARTVLSLAVLAVAFVGLVQTTHLEETLGPSAGGTHARTLEDWGAFLSPALLDLRRDAVRRYAGRRTEPGGPLYERELILDSFSANERTGWRFLYTATVALFFAAGLDAVRRVVRRPTLAIVASSTACLVVWARVNQSATRCEGSDCLGWVITVVALAAAGLAWGAYFTGVLIGRAVDRAALRTRRGPKA